MMANNIKEKKKKRKKQASMLKTKPLNRPVPKNPEQIAKIN